jgi:hypothetical protein
MNMLPGVLVGGVLVLLLLFGVPLPFLTELPPVPVQTAHVVQFTSHRLPLAQNAVYTQETIQKNIVASYEQSPGLRTGVILPGETWSIYEQWNVQPANLVTAYNQLGAGFCDMGGTYADAAVQAGLQVTFTPHDPPLRYAPAYANVLLWGTPGQRALLDLLITNNSSTPYHYRTVIRDGSLWVEAWFE